MIARSEEGEVSLVRCEVVSYTSACVSYVLVCPNYERSYVRYHRCVFLWLATLAEACGHFLAQVFLVWFEPGFICPRGQRRVWSARVCVRVGVRSRVRS